MSFGIQIKNPGQDLVISDSAKGLVCVGRATLQSIVQASGNGAGPHPGRTWGYSTYRISHSGPVIWAVDLPLNKRVGVLSSTEISAGLWEVVCCCGTTPDAYGFDTVQSELAVWAFGYVSTLAGTWGMAIYDAAGALSYDLTHPNPLFAVAYAVAPADGASAVTVPTLTRPVVLGFPTSDPAGDFNVSTNRWATVYWRAAWKRASSGTTMTAPLITKQRWEYSAIESDGMAEGDTYDAPCIFIEGNLLP